MAITVEELLVEFKADSARFAQEHRRVQESILKSESASLKLQKSLDNLHSKGAQGAQKMAGSYGDLAGELGLLSRLGGGGAFGVFGGVVAGTAAAAKEGIAYRETLDKLSKSFTTLLGSQQAAARMMGDLQALSARTPFEFEDVARGTQRFLNMGMAAKDIVPTLTAVGNAVAAAGGGSEQINRVSLALAQMTAKGKVSAEEMNQLAEAGVGGWRILEQQLGKTKGELMKMAEQGQISADTFIHAFRRAHESGDAMKRQMETLSGATSTLTDNTKLLLAVAFDPLHSALRDIAVELAKTSNEGFNLSRAFDAAAGAAVSLMKLNPSAATTWHVLGLNKIQLPQDSIVGQAFRDATNQIFAEQDQIAKRATEAGEAMNLALLKALKDGGAKREKVLKTDLDRLKEFIKEWDFIVSSTTGGRHNKGSLHYAGRAADVSVRGKSDQEIRAFMEAARAAGYGVRDERTRPAGQKVWGGPHLHLEALSKAAQAAARDARDEWARVASEMEQASEQGFDAFVRGEEERRAATAELRKEIFSQITALSEQETHLSRIDGLLKDNQKLGAVNDLTAAHLRQLAVTKDLLETMEKWGDLPGIPTPGPLGAQLPSIGPGPIVTDGGTAPANDIFGAQMKDVIQRVTDVRQAWRDGLLNMAEDGQLIFSNFFLDFQNGWKGAMGNMGLAFLQSLQQMAAQAAASAVWGWILRAAGAVAGGAISGGGGPLEFHTAGLGTSVFPRAAGGPVSPGQMYLVGERGPEFFVPKQSGTILPNGAGGGPTVQVTMNNTWQVHPGAQALLSRESESQAAERLSRRVEAELLRGRG